MSTNAEEELRARLEELRARLAETGLTLQNETQKSIQRGKDYRTTIAELNAYITATLETLEEERDRIDHLEYLLEQERNRSDDLEQTITRLRNNCENKDEGKENRNSGNVVLSPTSQSLGWLSTSPTPSISPTSPTSPPPTPPSSTTNSLTSPIQDDTLSTPEITPPLPTSSPNLPTSPVGASDATNSDLIDVPPGDGEQGSAPPGLDAGVGSQGSGDPGAGVSAGAGAGDALPSDAGQSEVTPSSPTSPVQGATLATTPTPSITPTPAMQAKIAKAQADIVKAQAKIEIRTKNIKALKKKNIVRRKISKELYDKVCPILDKNILKKFQKAYKTLFSNTSPQKKHDAFSSLRLILFNALRSSQLVQNKTEQVEETKNELDEQLEAMRKFEQEVGLDLFL